MSFTYHQDPGHGWLEVSAEDLDAAGLAPAAISSCSYVKRRRGDTTYYYLEEDCDMPLFLLAYYNRNGKQANVVGELHDGECFIRRLPPL